MLKNREDEKNRCFADDSGMLRPKRIIGIGMTSKFGVRRQWRWSAEPDDNTTTDDNITGINVMLLNSFLRIAVAVAVAVAAASTLFFFLVKICLIRYYIYF